MRPPENRHRRAAYLLRVVVANDSELGADALAQLIVDFAVRVEVFWVVALVVEAELHHARRRAQLAHVLVAPQHTR